MIHASWSQPKVQKIGAFKNAASHRRRPFSWCHKSVDIIISGALMREDPGHNLDTLRSLVMVPSAVYWSFSVVRLQAAYAAKSLTQQLERKSLLLIIMALWQPYRRGWAPRSLEIELSRPREISCPGKSQLLCDNSAKSVHNIQTPTKLMIFERREWGNNVNAVVEQVEAQ